MLGQAGKLPHLPLVPGYVTDSSSLQLDWLLTALLSLFKHTCSLRQADGCLTGAAGPDYSPAHPMYPTSCQLGEPTHSAYPEPQVPLSDKSDEDSCCFWELINQCCLTFSLCPRTYPSDTAKVGLSSLLTGDALAWASLLLESASPLLDNLEDFIQAIVKIFGDLYWVHIVEPSDM